MARLALVRHGQSQWNLENRFTGWVDVDLTEQGRAEAKKSGALLKKTGIEFSGCFTSVQKRAIRTLWIALDEMDRMWLPVTKSWRLNERHYGGLTGLNKAETAEKHGDEQVKIWRRSYDIPPPPMEKGSEFDLSGDPRYKLYGCDVPATESLKLTLERVQPYFEKEIAPRLKAGDSLMISAHGNSLRALVKILFNVSDDEIVHVEIPTGNPLLIDLDGGLQPTSADYLDAERATKIPSI
ncbi:2,3-diphosphoglycerate-dependent phosphoglycerate mutase [Hyphococcus sp.]|uniref:2,3-diphosphoglycerate-dependent phosphoglycerate mutase n=1 Tax=Hyphococcus sp. TaxID=2038636 RepID=UPI0035C6DA89